jgi:hypothetical protein
MAGFSSALNPTEAKNASFQPVDSDLLFQRLEFGVGSNEFRLFALGQCGGEGVGEAEIMFELEVGGGCARGRPTGLLT